MKFFSYSLALTLLLSACTTVDEDKVASVSIIPAGLSQHCILKGNVYSEAPYYGVFTETTEDKLVDLAKESAARLGANALVPDKPQKADSKYILTGKAYSCVQ
jgi:hypothetical protein